jgi:hypothetical protein
VFFRWFAVWFLLVAPWVVQGAVPSSVSACAACHPQETESHSHTRMANAMMPAAQSSFVQNLPQQPLHEAGGGFLFVYKQIEAGTQVTSYRGLESADGLIQWVLGAGAQGQTPLVYEGKNVRESRVSYFPQLHQYGITVGQSAAASANAIDALGVKQNAHDTQACLGCHSTSTGKDGQTMVPGVQCVRCHPGAEGHAQGHGIPFNPGKLKASAQVEFCGACHRTKAPLDDAQLENLRFQPLRLMKSRCFVNGGAACTTCHAAHQDARRNEPNYYNTKCHSCHDAKPVHADSRQSGNCIGCHMPQVQLHPALRFTDHYIRVVKNAPAIPN